MTHRGLFQSLPFCVVLCVILCDSPAQPGQCVGRSQVAACVVLRPAFLHRICQDTGRACTTL